VAGEDVEVAIDAVDEMYGRFLEPGDGARIDVMVIHRGTDFAGVGVVGVIPSVVLTAEGLLVLRQVSLLREHVDQTEDAGVDTTRPSLGRLKPYEPQAPLPLAGT
jgi:hypothetical protein